MTYPTRLLFVLLVLGTGLGTVPVPAGRAWAQAPPAPQALLRPWLAGQARHATGRPAFTFRESAEYVLDGPFGTRRVRQEVRVAGGAERERWARRYLAVSVNGRAVPPERWDDREQRRHGMSGVPLDRIMRATHLVPRLFERLEPAGPVTQGDVDGDPCWRLELVPRGERRNGLALERLTVWIDAHAPRLRRTRALFRRQGTDAPFVATTDYVRVEGLDVPRARHVEGTIQHKRRMRTFTNLFTYDATYTDYRFERD